MVFSPSPMLLSALNKRLWLFLSLALGSLSSLRAHPADTDGDSALSADEVADFLDTDGPKTERSLQAVNIWKHGESYRSLSADGDTYFIPSPSSGDEYVAADTLAPDAATFVTLHGLPDHPAGYRTYYYDPAVESVVFDGNVTQRDGDWVLVVPTHPIDAMAGGALEFTLYPADAAPTQANSFRTGTLNVQGLPPAPGTLKRVRQKTDALVSQLEADLGIDFSQYFTGAPREFGPFENRGEQTLILIVRYLTDPNFPQGIVELDEEILDDSNPFVVNLRAEIDALLAREDLPSLIDRFALDPFGDSAGASETDRVSLHSLTARSSPRMSSNGDGPSNAAELSEQMTEQYVASQLLQDELFQTEFGAGNAAVGLAGAPGQIVSAQVGLTVSGLRLYDEEKAFTNPARGAVTAAFGETHFYADDCDRSSSWTATATASSLGWSVDGAKMDLAVSLIGLGGAAASAAKFAKPATQATQVADDGMKAALNKRAFETTKATTEFSAGEAAKAVASKESSNEVPPETWSGIPLDENYAKMVQIGSPIVDVDGDTYTPVAPGEAAAYISAGQPHFPPGALRPSTPAPLIVEEAIVTLSGCPPATYTPGQSYTLVAKVDGLREKEGVTFSWESTHGAVTPQENAAPGQAEAIWEAPNPAPTDAVSITATADANICIPKDAAPPTDSCTTRGVEYELEVSPSKDCYDTDEVVTLTFKDKNNPSLTPSAEFELVTGSATLTQVSPNAATVTVDSSGEVGVAARLVSDPNQLQTAVMTFGCGDALQLSFSHGNESDILFFTKGVEVYTLYGNFTVGGGLFTAHFDADSTYQFLLANTSEDGPVPAYGDVGVNPAAQARIINPNLSVSLNFEYQEIDCAGGEIPATVCIEAKNVTPQSVVIEGFDYEYEFDPFHTGTFVGEMHGINVVPKE